MANLYLIPNQLSTGDWKNVLPLQVSHLISEIKYFIVENTRNARRFLKMIDREINIDDLVFFELNEHSIVADIPGFLKPLESGNHIALLSEAGCPGVADPGAEVIRLAHSNGYRVVPLVGPSSILLALMASGMNGQNFAFRGYLPVKPVERSNAIRKLERCAWEDSQTQIFIETPYRNNQLFGDLIKYLRNETLLGIAADLTGVDEFISVAPVAAWKNRKPDLHHRPAVFMIYKS